MIQKITNEGITVKVKSAEFAGEEVGFLSTLCVKMLRCQSQMITSCHTEPAEARADLSNLVYKRGYNNSVKTRSHYFTHKIILSL